MELKTFTDGQKLLDETDWNEPILAKGLPFDEKVEFMRFCLTTPGNRNISILANISITVKGSNLDEKEFEDEMIVYKDLEEYVDIKQELSAEIKAFRNELAKWFLAAFKSMSIVLPDGKVMVPETYKHVLATFDVKDVSKILRNADVEFNSLPKVFDGENIINSIMRVDPLMKEICAALQGLIPEEE